MKRGAEGGGERGRDQKQGSSIDKQTNELTFTVDFGRRHGIYGSFCVKDLGSVYEKGNKILRGKGQGM